MRGLWDNEQPVSPNLLRSALALAGVRPEDVTDIVLNLKRVAIRMVSDTPKRMTLKASGGGPIRAGQIETSSDIEILNPDHIADAYWGLHAQPRDAWTHELDLRPWMESF